MGQGRSKIASLLVLQFEGGLPVLLGAGVLGGALLGSQFRSSTGRSS